MRQMNSVTTGSYKHLTSFPEGKQEGKIVLPALPFPKKAPTNPCPSSTMYALVKYTFPYGPGVFQTVASEQLKLCMCPMRIEYPILVPLVLPELSPSDFRSHAL